MQVYKIRVAYQSSLRCAYIEMHELLNLNQNEDSKHILLDVDPQQHFQTKHVMIPIA